MLQRNQSSGQLNKFKRIAKDHDNTAERIETPLQYTSAISKTKTFPHHHASSEQLIA